MTTTQPPLDLPLYGASFPQAIGRFFKKYATFTGRASRSEFWWVQLFLWLVLVILGVGTGILGAATRNTDSVRNEPGAGALVFGVPLILFLLAIIVPAIALHVRRLHDANFSGLLYLIVLVPQIGGLVLMILAAIPTNPAGAQYDRGAAALPYQQGGTPPAPAAAPSAETGYTPAPPVQAGPPPQASPPPPVPPADPTA
jgi:uncharacterized membrane protein YhaH (DUF805 family)